MKPRNFAPLPGPRGIACASAFTAGFPSDGSSVSTQRKILTPATSKVPEAFWMPSDSVTLSALSGMFSTMQTFVQP